jgi:hypothetical protein
MISRKLASNTDKLSLPVRRIAIGRLNDASPGSSWWRIHSRRWAAESGAILTLDCAGL